jgi:hypothetical protein
LLTLLKNMTWEAEFFSPSWYPVMHWIRQNQSRIYVMCVCMCTRILCVCIRVWSVRLLEEFCLIYKYKDVRHGEILLHYTRFELNSRGPRLLLMPRFRISDVIPALFHTPSCRA